MGEFETSRIFNTFRHALAFFCLAYAVFYCGFSYGLSLTEKMYAAEGVVQTSIFFSGAADRDYSDLLQTSISIAVCMVVFLALTRFKASLLSEALSLLIILLVILLYQYPLPFRPTYIPGQSQLGSPKYLEATVWADMSFACCVFVLTIMQFVSIWKLRKSSGKVA